MAAQRAYAGVPATERRALRRAALLEAALEIIGTQGFAKLTVAGLCAQAGLNERYYYESFATRDSVLHEVFDSVVAELAQAIMAAVELAPDDAEAKARAAIRAAVELLTDDPRKSRVAFVEGLSNEGLAARRTEVMTTFAHLVAHAGQEFYGPEATLKAGKRAEFAAVHLVGGLFETVTAWLGGGLDITKDELIEQSADLFVAIGDHLRSATN
ncbi:TetR/AcrR family transcriptional regulator [Antrihabitans sp. YC2-6]|uniref:TetR/AcrR family transcriptional regulator n=1 Tax=Antrihabitans sp. YC2-6 TaxID=2799498 RepID=UPI0018F7A594|nr:TetR/AcrR family transcriptional regulator [Antrihabitans sp. YC2-6]MBJ8345347.1 TetR/AcrR family transcriptional regulator [Antrihabitans sp. YC2-6]